MYNLSSLIDQRLPSFITFAKKLCPESRCPFALGLKQFFIFIFIYIGLSLLNYLMCENVQGDLKQLIYSNRS